MMSQQYWHLLHYTFNSFEALFQQKNPTTFHDGHAVKCANPKISLNLSLNRVSLILGCPSK